MLANARNQVFALCAMCLLSMKVSAQTSPPPAACPYAQGELSAGRRSMMWWVPAAPVQQPTQSKTSTVNTQEVQDPGFGRALQESAVTEKPQASRK
jgi:hypothetical protein